MINLKWFSVDPGFVILIVMVEPSYLGSMIPYTGFVEDNHYRLVLIPIRMENVCVTCSGEMRCMSALRSAHMGLKIPLAGSEQLFINSSDFRCSWILFKKKKRKF